MAPRQGYASYIAFANEDPWGTKVVTGMSFMEFLNESIAKTIEEKIVQGINNSRVRTKRVLGAKLVAGDVAWEVNPEDGIGEILKNILPEETFTDDGVGNGGQHKFVEGETLPIGQTAQISRGGLVFDHFGGRINSLQLTSAASELLQATTNLSFKDEDDGIFQTPSYTDEPPLVYHAGTVTVDGSDSPLTNFQVTIETGLRADRRRLAVQTIMQQSPGPYAITGSIALAYEDNVLVDKFRSGAAIKIVLDLTGNVIGTTTRRLRITVPVAFLNAQTPQVPGMDEIQLTLPFVAIKDGTGTPDNLIQIELFNSLRSAY